MNCICPSSIMTGTATSSHCARFSADCSSDIILFITATDPPTFCCPPTADVLRLPDTSAETLVLAITCESTPTSTDIATAFSIEMDIMAIKQTNKFALIFIICND